MELKEKEAIGQINYMRSLLRPPATGLGGIRLMLILIGAGWMSSGLARYFAAGGWSGGTMWATITIFMVAAAVVAFAVRDARRARRSTGLRLSDVRENPILRTLVGVQLLLAALAVLAAAAGAVAPRFGHVYVWFWMGAGYLAIGIVAWSKEHAIVGGWVVASAVASTWFPHAEQHLFFGLAAGGGLILLMLYFGRLRRGQPARG